MYLVILQECEATELLPSRCMININQIPHFTIRTMRLRPSSFFHDCFYLPPSSALLSLSEILSTSLSLPPLTLQSLPVLDLLPPPLRLSHSLECTHLLAQSFTHLSYFSFSPTLFTYDLPELCLLLIPAQLANKNTLMILQY